MPHTKSNLSVSVFEQTLRKIPLAAAMQVRVRAYDGNELVLAAPLEPNVNDKGCAFGGSLASLLTLAGWGLILLRLDASGLDCDIYVQDSTVRYLKPLWGDIVARAALRTTLSDADAWEAFFAALAVRGRARLGVACSTPTETGDEACTLEARFVAIMRKP